MGLGCVATAHRYDPKLVHTDLAEHPPLKRTLCTSMTKIKPIPIRLLAELFFQEKTPEYRYASLEQSTSATFHIYCFVHGSTQEGDKENQRENLWSLN